MPDPKLIAVAVRLLPVRLTLFYRLIGGFDGYKHRI